MKKLFSIFVLISRSLLGFTQNIVRIDSGTLNCAQYKILIPRNWHNKLVMFAHGYQMMGSPSAINSPQFQQFVYTNMTCF